MTTRLLALLPLLALGCGSDVLVSSAPDEPDPEPVCDGRKQPGEEYTDSPFDKDGDGFVDGTNIDCKATYEPDDLDCNDADPDVTPQELEETCNGKDDDCDDSTPDSLDEEIACNGVDDDCNPNTMDAPDLDYDGVDACSDCDDSDPNNAPTFDEECDDFQDNDCDGEIDEGCAPDYTGTWDLESTISYSCAFGIVSINFNALLINHVDPNLNVSAASGSQPGSMNGTLQEDGSFTVSNTLTGTCNETYSVTGSFLDDVTFTGTFSAQYTGSACFDCLASQSWPVTGQLR